MYVCLQTHIDVEEHRDAFHLSSMGLMSAVSLCHAHSSVIPIHVKCLFFIAVVRHVNSEEH